MYTRRVVVVIALAVIGGLALIAAASLIGYEIGTSRASAPETPFAIPTTTPTAMATPSPTAQPTQAPAATPSPTAQPTQAPAVTPSPTAQPAATSTPSVPAPVVQINTPASGTRVFAGQPVTIQFTAMSSVGLNRVEVSVDGAIYATFPGLSPAPSTMNGSQIWSSTISGDHTLAVRAFDTLGQISTGTSIVVTVVSAPAPPVVWFTQPTSPTGRIVVQAGSQVQLEYWATSDASLSRLELWVDGQVYATDVGSDQSHSMHITRTWSSTAVGDHTLLLRAYDTLGQSTDSQQLIIGIASPNPPTLSILYPNNGELIPPNENVGVQVSASDSKGIVRLELWVDGALSATWTSPTSVGESSVQTTLTWVVPSPGLHTIYVVAMDSVGLTAATPANAVTVLTPAVPTSTPGPIAAPTPTPTPAPASQISGEWTGLASPTGELWHFTLSQSGNTLSGTLTITPPAGEGQTGSLYDSLVTSSSLSINIDFGAGRPITRFDGTLQADGTITGTWHTVAGQFGTLTLRRLTTGS